MTQPDYVPLQAPDRVRASDRLSTPRAWRAERPGDLTEMKPPSGTGFGSSGPDQGYGLKLARRFHDRLVLGAGEDVHDVELGCFACATKRSASFGRAPVIYAFEWAYTLWGYLGGAADALVGWRTPLFKGVGHSYIEQRRVVDLVADPTYAMTPAAVAAAVAGDGWRTLFS